MRYVTAVAAAVGALLGNGCGGDSDDRARSMPDGPAPCSGTAYEDPEDVRARRWKLAADHAAVGVDSTDVWVGLARVLPLDQAVTLADDGLALRGVVVVYPLDDGTVSKATIPLSTETSADAVRATVQSQLGDTFRHALPVAQTSLRRLDQGDIPVGAVRLGGSTDDLVRFVRTHRCDVHSLQIGTIPGPPVLSREVDPS